MSESSTAAAAAPAAASVATPAAGEVTTAAATVTDPAATGETALATSILTDPVVDPSAPKPGEETKPGEEKPDPKPGEETKPVEYTDFTLPEGLTAEDPTLAKFREEAGKLGLSQEQAQALVTEVGKQVADQAAQRVQDWINLNNTWQAEIKADPETGGENFETMRTNVAKVFDDYCGPPGSPDRIKLTQELLMTGAGNRPTLTKVMARIAAAHTEGGHVNGNPVRTKPSTAELMYPTHTQVPAGSR